MSVTISQQQQTVVDSLADEECPACGGGQLERQEYKEDEALVCPSCGTPTVRLFA